MLVRRETVRQVRVPDMVAALVAATERLASVARPSPDAILESLLDAGALELGVAEASPHTGADHPDTQTWRTVTLALGRAFVAATGREQQHAPAHLAHAALVAGFAGELPPTMADSPVEGFARAALYPQMYIAAARLLVQARRPAQALVLGVGPAGAALSAVVTAALEQQRVDCETALVGPRAAAALGHGRSEGLQRRIGERPGALVVLVGDIAEGWLGRVAAAVRDARVADPRLVLLPGRVPDPPELGSAEDRDACARHAAFAVPFESAVLAKGLHGHTPGRLRDLSFGAWRALPAIGGGEIPTHPHQERRKYLTAAAVHGRVLLKFAGLGRHGRARLARAEQLAAAGFTPAPDALANGFLAVPWVEGTPLRAPEVDEAALCRMGDYLAWLRLHARTTEPADPVALGPMLRANVAGALGETLDPAAARACEAAARLPQQPALAIDGTMFPHEWIQTPGGLAKVDALEHHDDPFYPGTHDIAWDLAGAMSECGLDDRAAAFLVEHYVRATGDAVSDRLPYYQLAYEAFRVGYDALAARELAATADGPRFAARARDRRIRLARFAARFA